MMQMALIVGDPNTTGVFMSRWVVSDVTSPPTDAVASLTLNADGTISAAGFGTIPGSPNWYNPTSGSIGSSYWVRATRTNGVDPDVGTMGAWLSLASGQTWSSTASGAGTSQLTEMTLEFSTDAAGVTVVATVPLWYLIADVTDSA